MTTATKVEKVTILVTPKEAEVLAWASEPMMDYWMDEDERTFEGNATYAAPLVVDRKRLAATMVFDGAVLSDLQYRLLTQLPDMMKGSSFSRAEAAAEIHAATMAFDKFDEAFKAVYL